ncbi:MAG: endopeptidase La [bacterium]
MFFKDKNRSKDKKSTLMKDKKEGVLDYVSENKKLVPITELPLLPLREVVIFPYMIVPLFIGRTMSIKAIEEAVTSGNRLFLVAQKRGNVDDPTKEDIYNIGTVADILQILKLPDGTVKVLVEGQARYRVLSYTQDEDYYKVEIEKVEQYNTRMTPELEAVMRATFDKFDSYVKLSSKLPPEAAASVSNIEDPGKLADVVAAHLVIKMGEKQRILEELDPLERLFKIIDVLDSEIKILNLEKRIRNRVKKQMEKTQKEYYLNEQMKAIQNELGAKDDLRSEVKELETKIKGCKMPSDIEEKTIKELKRLEMMPPMSAEGTVVRNYIDWLISLPWDIRTKDIINIKRAESILNEDHCSLEKAKERILEFLAVRKLVNKMQGPILCFVGPPGVGKTSLAKSIARALGKKFVRLSLGGVRDEAEIRGHRRTYIGALPGRIIQSMKRAQARNPVFLLDEIDKMSMDFRGDPSAALLEVLDPEQNSSFSDHFLEVDFDLSEVMFITTANAIHKIPTPLLDRMEIISIPSYTDIEKAKIAKLFLIPKQLKAHGLKNSNLTFSEKGVFDVIHRYTREAGVRNLEREIAHICRKVAKEVVQKGKKNTAIVLSTKSLYKYLGRPRFRDRKTEEKNNIGIVTGLAWTEAGGDILAIEVNVMDGKGKLIITGQVGEVMQESAQAALSYIRSRTKELGLADGLFQKIDIHIHVPEGAIPKDGPSAGITMATALASALTHRPVNRNIAMTGEITLRGRVLPIGGIKEKVIAAHRAGISTVILPKENKKELDEVPKSVRKAIKFVSVENMDEVLKRGLVEKEGELSEHKQEMYVDVLPKKDNHLPASVAVTH